MAKTKTPVLSLGAHGTIGKAITYQKHGTQTIIREKPFPKQPDTLAQQYQRWLYEDYCYRWQQLSASEKQTYQSAGVRFHLTGFQYWMKYNLTLLPDIAGRWHLDAPGIAITPDASRNSNTGTIIGASPATGLIDGCLSFDGVNDWVGCGTSSTLALHGDFTIIGYWHPSALQNQIPIFREAVYTADGYLIFFKANGTLEMRLMTPVLKKFNTNVNSYTATDWQTIAFIRSGNQGFIYRNNVDITLFSDVLADPVEQTAIFRIGRPVILGGFNFSGPIDHLTVYNRALDFTERQTYQERRWP